MFKRLRNLFITAAIFLFSAQAQLLSLSLTDASSALGDIFSSTVSANEGETSFRSFLIPFGGRAESLGNAYTGLCNDISFLRFNPAAGAIQNQTQLALFHNSWIADSKMETLAYTTRLKNLRDLSLGGYISCFYVPFTEYDAFGCRTTGSYYTETTGAFNIAYNFFSGYEFKGLALGATLKTAWRGVPDYTDNNSGAIISGSGLEQCALCFAADLGAMLQFNFLKFFYSREPNVRIGFTAQNLGAAITGFGSKQGIQLDDPILTLFGTGISVQIVKAITISLDVKQPVNLSNMNGYLFPYFGAGFLFQFTDNLAFLSGFELKGANPKFSTGFEFEFKKIQFNVNYTLDLATSINPLNRISLSAKIKLGDKGRSLIDAKVDEYYEAGLKFYADGEWEKAISIWQEALKINRRFDPAIIGIESAQYQIDMFEKIRQSLLIE